MYDSSIHFKADNIFNSPTNAFIISLENPYIHPKKRIEVIKRINPAHTNI